MSLRAFRWSVFTLIIGLVVWTLPVSGQYGAKGGEWRAYAGEPGSTKYSPLDQINKDNAKNLRIAWRFKADNLGPLPDYNMQAVPLMVGGVIYTQAGSRRDVVALDPTTGEMLWMWRMDEGERGRNAPRQGSGRGIAYWTDGRGDDRVYTITPGYHLVALTAKTGIPVSSFGRNGVVDLKTELDQTIDPVTGEIGLNSPPVIANNVLVVGAAHLSGAAPKTKEHVKGYIRGYDVRTGKRLWIFHTIPQPGEFGNDTWLNDSWAYTGNAGNWAPITIDEQLDRAYLAIEDGTGDYYGGHRPGNNLFTASIVCVDLKTGKRYWHYQLVHHDIWDWDIPAPPVLMDITVDGKPIKAVAVITKQGWVYTFDRVTGAPVWPIEERPVPAGKVPSEWYAPTQPHPTKPVPFDRQGITENDVVDWTPEIKAEALRVLSLHKHGPSPFVPPAAVGEDFKFGSLQVPGNNGGANWEGGTFDPETGMLYVFSSTQPSRRALINDPKASNMNFIEGRGRNPSGVAGIPAGTPVPPPTVFGLPLIKPPYGRITAINMHTGEHVWQVPNGGTPENIANHEKLKGIEIPKTGRPGRTGTMVTKTLLWAGERGPLVSVNGQQGSWFRAYDKATGATVAEILVPANVSNVPMTYMVNNKQYIIVAVSATGHASELVALTLP